MTIIKIMQLFNQFLKKKKRNTWSILDNANTTIFFILFGVQVFSLYQYLVFFTYFITNFKILADIWNPILCFMIVSNSCIFIAVFRFVLVNLLSNQMQYIELYINLTTAIIFIQNWFIWYLLQTIPRRQHSFTVSYFHIQSNTSQCNRISIWQNFSLNFYVYSQLIPLPHIPFTSTCKTFGKPFWKWL